MASMKEQMQRLIDLREKYLGAINQHQRSIEALQNQLAGIDAAMRALGAEPGVAPAPQRNVKRTVLEIVHAAGKVGVTASEVIAAAAAKGRSLKAGSVASLLSRFKQENVLTFDGERYYAAVPQTPQEPPLKIVKTANGG